MFRALSRSLFVGVAAGARTSLGPAAVAFATPRPDAPRPVAALQGTAGRSVAALLVLGELTGDKLPQAPSRLDPPALGGRLVSGALGGSAVAPSGSAAASLGALTGVAGALVGAYGGARWRAWVADRGRPDWPAALAEDVVAIALAWRAATTARHR